MANPHPLALLFDALKDGPVEERLSPEGVPIETLREVVRTAALHQVAPLLSLRWRDHLPPGPELSELEGWYHKTAQDNLRRFHELGEILGAFSAAGVGVIVLKGPHLAAVAYESLALRSMDDLDLLVRPEEAGRATHLLRRLGYAQADGLAEDRRPGCHHLHPFSGLDRTPVEIHVHLVPDNSPFSISADGLWNRTGQANIADNLASVFAPEDLVLHLCLHAAYGHRFRTGIRPLCDLATVLRSGEGDALDWGEIIARAQRWQAAPEIYLTLLFASEFLAAEVPTEAMRSLQPERADHSALADLGPEFFDLEREPYQFGALGRLVSSKPLGERIRLFANRLRSAVIKPKVTSRHILQAPANLAWHVRRHVPAAWRLASGNKGWVARASQAKAEWEIRDLLDRRD